MTDIPIDQYTLAKYEHLSAERRELADELLAGVLTALIEHDTANSAQHEIAKSTQTQ